MGYHAADLVRPGLIWGLDPPLVAWLAAAVARAAGAARLYAMGTRSFVPGLAGLAVRHAVVQQEGVPQGEFAFLKRFRDAGGRPLAMDVPAFARVLSDDGLGAGTAATVMLCNDLADAEPLRQIDPEGPTVMVFGSPSRHASRELTDWLMRGHTIELGVDTGPVRQRLLLLCFGLEGQALARALADTAPPDWIVDPQAAAGARRSDLAAVTTVRARRADPLPQGPVSRLVPALDFIHDGRYAVEGDRGYSWLWTGPDPHFRICLGELPPGPAELRLCVASTKEPRNLDEATLLFNGRRVPHTLDRWSPTSGRFNVTVADVPPGLSILSVAVPHLTSDDAGTRKLALCVDKVEVITCPATSAS